MSEDINPILTVGSLSLQREAVTDKTTEEAGATV
jgi:hypothetical protein